MDDLQSFWRMILSRGWIASTEIQTEQIMIDKYRMFSLFEGR